MSSLRLSGSSVLVTGASSGLGRAVALRLASAHKAQPILVGRRLENLLDLQAEILSRYGVSSEIVSADQSTAEGCAAIVAKVDELNPTAVLLIAGVTSVGRFDAARIAEYREVIETNVFGSTMLLAHIVDVFRRRQSNAAILCVSSLGAETSVPYQAVYSATKAYVNTLVQALSVELAGTDISVGSFLPGGIDTSMAAQSDLRWGKTGLMSVDRCAALAIQALIRRRLIVVPGLGNRLTYLASRALPRSLIGRVAAIPYRRPE